MKNCLNIPDEVEGYDHSLFAIPAHYQDSLGNVIIPYGLIQGHQSVCRSTFKIAITGTLGAEKFEATKKIGLKYRAFGFTMTVHSFEKNDDMKD